MHKNILGALLISFLLSSCGTIKSVQQTASNATQSVKQTAMNTSKNIADFALMRPKIQVVEPREEDLKPLPLGKERALAFDQERKRSFWSYVLPNFKEPNLPVIDDQQSDGSLLPPKS